MTKHSDRATRRSLILLTPMPQPRHDAVVVLQINADGMDMRLRYVPDRDVIQPSSFEIYLREVLRLDADSLLARAQMILEDINDQVIPCWAEVRLCRFSEQAIIEDKQPRWTDPGILGRLGT